MRKFLHNSSYANLCLRKYIYKTAKFFLDD